jgi:PAS domain-containing protein
MTTTTIETAIESIERIELRAHARDLAACKKIERRLFDSEQRYRSLFDASPHPMWVYDRRTFSFLVVNEAAIQSYGYSAPEFHSMIVTDIECPNQTTLENTRRTGRRQHLKKDWGRHGSGSLLAPRGF